MRRTLTPSQAPAHLDKRIEAGWQLVTAPAIAVRRDCLDDGYDSVIASSSTSPGAT